MNNKILIFTASLVLLSCKKEDKTIIEQTTVEETAADTDVLITNCYIAVTPIQEEGKAKNDTISLNFERKGDSITGQFKWLPYYKDKKTGTFKGIVKGNSASTILTAQGEGIINKEEFIFDIDTDKVSIKMGELAEGKDGIWHYKDKSATSENAIPKTDCK